jgi:hypothetical protein
MKKHFPKSTCKLSDLFKVFIAIFIGASCSSCSILKVFDEDDAPLTVVQNTNYLKAQALVLNREFEKAVPFLDLSLKSNDADYANALLLSLRAYDQLGQPEKAVLAAQELLTKTIEAPAELKTRSLLLKNLAKVGTDISDHQEKKLILNLTQKSESDGLLVLEGLKWSMDFSCDQFCVAEIVYLKEIQLQFLYIIEKDAVSSDRAADIIKSRYEFFQSFLSKEHLDLNFRKKIAVALIDSLKKLSSLQLAMPNQGAVRAASFMLSVSPVEKSVESWLYKL